MKMNKIQIKRRDFLWGLAGLSGSVVASQLPISPASALIKINGAGASFPAPLYQRWFVEYNKADKNVQVNYQSVGSGAGVKQFISGTVDFGASDVAMTDDEIKQVGNGVVLLPVTAGSIVIAYNNKDVPNLKLSRQQLVDVFLGKIKDWKQLGSSKSKPIKVVHRSDGSGTTGVFTKHLSAISSEWKGKVGEGKTVQWPTGIGAKGNEGVTATILQTDGSIGYIEYGYAKNNNLKTAQLQNKAGSYVSADLKSASETLSKVTLPSNLRAFIADPDGAGSYPIVTYSWILAYQKYSNAETANTLKKVLNWCVSKTGGQKYSAQLGYIPLPDNVITKVNSAINSIS
jgi:phosphate transport system substrate-binding protein